MPVTDAAGVVSRGISAVFDVFGKAVKAAASAVQYGTEEEHPGASAEELPGSAAGSNIAKSGKGRIAPAPGAQGPSLVGGGIMSSPFFLPAVLIGGYFLFFRKKGRRRR